MLSKQHFKLLRRIEKDCVVRDAVENKDLEYLYSRGYVELMEYHSAPDHFTQAFLTEQGKARLDQYRRETARFWIPTAISIAAFIVSIVALLLGRGIP